ncbi:hypothetical protein GEMRC1_005738 [Eukaryota sp. GEM-RC1]
MTSAPARQNGPRKTRANADNLLRGSVDSLFYATNLFSTHCTIFPKDKRADWMTDIRESRCSDADTEIVGLIDQFSKSGALDLEETLDLYLHRGKITMLKDLLTGCSNEYPWNTSLWTS